MVCFDPFMGYEGTEINPETGKRKPTFAGTRVWSGELVPFACGGCIGCRLDRAESWGIRGSHEAHMHEYYVDGKPGSAFLTLTFDNEHLPTSNSLRICTLQDFIRELRRRLKLLGFKGKLRYFACGEYGERFGRAHYHVALFGYDFPDRVLYKTTKGGHRLYESALLTEVWGQGNAFFGDVTFKSSFYVAGYVAKRIGGDKAAEYYRRVSPVDGQFYSVEPEFSVCSLKPGLGASWFAKYASDVFPSDEVIIAGHPRKPPRYYEKLYGEELMKPVKRKRLMDARRKSGDRSRERLRVREECMSRRLLIVERGVH